MTPKAKELVGIAEIAVLCKTSPQAVSNWRVRHSASRSADPFPKPLTQLASGPVFDKQVVVQWLLRNEKVKLINTNPITNPLKEMDA